MLDRRFAPEPTSAPGEFYVENHCCTSCGVPQSVAPDLVGWIDADMSHCYWKKQPETPGELERAFLILNGQELGCHRYAGSNAEIQRRVGHENCDRVMGYWAGRTQEFSKGFWKRMRARR